MKESRINKAKQPCSKGLKVELTGGLSTSVIRCFPRIPNIREMILEGAVPDYLMSEEGIVRNLPRKITFKLLDRDDTVNKYLNHMERRLHKLRIERRGAAFGAVSNYLVRKSQIFFLLALRQVGPTGYKDKNLKSVLALYPAYKRYVRREKVLTLFRVGIDKADGSKRPLGVPQLICRLLLYQMNKILQVAFLDDIPAYQHAYQPGKGTLTAGRDVIGKVLPAKYIGEFDLTKFFDSIDQREILRLLESRVQMQGGFLDLVETHLRSGVETEAGSEPDQDDKKAAQAFRGLRPDLLSLMDGPIGGNQFGVPQGANTSPMLAIFALRELYKCVEMGGIKLIMYADDGILYSDKSFAPQMVIQNAGVRCAGISFNTKKSYGVKSAGKGKRNLKFLGLTYFHEIDKLGGTPRIKDPKKLEILANGGEIKPLLFDKHDLIKAIRCRDKEDGLMSPILAHDLPKNNGGVKWKDFMFSSVLGFIQSRLYEGEGNPTRLVLVDHLKAKRNSWCAKYMKEFENINLGNASSFAYASLLGMLSMRKRHALKLGSTCEYTFNEEEKRYEATKIHKALPPTDDYNKESNKAFADFYSSLSAEDLSTTAVVVYDAPPLSLIPYEKTLRERLLDLINPIPTETVGIAHVLRRISFGRLRRNRAFYDSLPYEAKQESKMYAEDRQLMKGRKARKSDARPQVLLMPAVNRIDPFADDETPTESEP